MTNPKVSRLLDQAAAIVSALKTGNPKHPRNQEALSLAYGILTQNERDPGIRARIAHNLDPRLALAEASHRCLSNNTTITAGTALGIAPYLGHDHVQLTPHHKLSPHFLEAAKLRLGFEPHQGSPKTDSDLEIIEVHHQQVLRNLALSIQDELPVRNPQAPLIAFGMLGLLPADGGTGIGLRNPCLVIDPPDPLATDDAQALAVAVYRNDSHQATPTTRVHSPQELGQILEGVLTRGEPFDAPRSPSKAQQRAFQSKVTIVQGTPIPPSRQKGRYERKFYNVNDPSDPDPVFVPWHPTLALATREIDQDRNPTGKMLGEPLPHPTPLAVPQALFSRGSPSDQPPQAQIPSISFQALSHAQIESCLRANHALQGKIENNYRQGFLLGDGTGTGKGRTISTLAAMGWLSENPSAKRTVWFSASPALIKDATRDLTDIGFRADRIFELPDNQAPVGAPSVLKRKTSIKERITTLDHLGDGVLFVTYQALRYKHRRNAVIQWLSAGENLKTAEPTIIFDECQHIQGAGGEKPSRQGYGSLILQKALPQARVIYASSTAFHQPQTYAYAERLGLWKTKKAPFLSQGHFYYATKTGGIAALELIARELRHEGLSEVRLLSLAGVDQDPLAINLTQEQLDIHNMWADAWREVHEALMEVLPPDAKNPDADVTFSSIPQSRIATVRQRFNLYLITSYRGPALIQEIEKDLAENRAPVVQLAATFENVQDRRIREVLKDRDHDGHTLPLSSDLTPIQDVIEQVEKYFPIHQYNVDSYGNIVVALDKQGEPLVDANMLAHRARAIQALKKPSSYPKTLLDQLVHHFGNRISEVTGRSRRTVHRQKDGVEWLEVEPRNNQICLEEAEDFMTGRRQVLVFSSAGATGRSYHADTDCPNQKRRVHYLAEPGGGAHTVVQGLGRTHRTRQVSCPIVRLVATDLPGERRIMAQTVRNLNALGAATRGDRRAQGNTWFTAIPDFDSGPGKRALNTIFELWFEQSGHINNQGLMMVPTLQGFEEAADITAKSTTSRKLKNQSRGVALDPKIHVLQAGDIDSNEWCRISGFRPKDRPTVAGFLNRMMTLRVPAQRKLVTAFEKRLAHEKAWGEEHAIDNTTIMRLEQPTAAISLGKVPLPYCDEAWIEVLDSRNPWSWSWAGQGASAWTDLMAGCTQKCELWFLEVRVQQTSLIPNLRQGPVLMKLPKQENRQYVDAVMFRQNDIVPLIGDRYKFLPQQAPNIDVNGKICSGQKNWSRFDHLNRSFDRDVIGLANGIASYMDWSQAGAKGSFTRRHKNDKGHLLHENNSKQAVHSMPLLFLTGKLLRVLPYLPTGRRIRTTQVKYENQPESMSTTLTGIPLTAYEMAITVKDMANKKPALPKRIKAHRTNNPELDLDEAGDPYQLLGLDQPRTPQ